MKKVIPKKKKTKEGSEPLIFFNLKKRIFVMMRQKSDKSKFILLSNKKDSNKEFNKRGKKVHFDSKKFIVDFSKIKDFHLTEFGKELVLTFNDHNQTFLFFSKDGTKWIIKSVLPEIIENGCLSPCKTSEGKFAYFYGNKEIKVAYSSDLVNWKSEEVSLIKPRIGFFDKNNLQIVSAYLSEKGVGLIYESSFQSDWKRHLKTGYILLAKNDLSKVIWRADSPLTEGSISAGGLASVSCLGTILKEGIFYVYYKSGTKMFIISGRDPFSSPIETTHKLIRSVKNPIIWPKNTLKWQSMGTFNPGAVFLDAQVHLVYRAVGDNSLSTIGYALLEDGLHIKSQSDQPIFLSQPASEFSKKLPRFVYESGPGGLGGSEDPRLTKIGKTIYMTYVAFNGYEAPRVAMTSISVDDFLNKKWTWRKPIFLSKRNQTQKNWVLFPEKISGKFALLSSLSPEVQIFYFDKLPTSDIELESQFRNKTGARRWDNLMRRVGSPPIKTEYGWLVLYHAMDIRDPNRYKVGAMILDYKNPEKILFRSANPILEPDKNYENEGYKAGVVYVCGAVVVEDTLFVYYGGADTVVCVATIPFQKFMKSLTAKTQEEMSCQEFSFI